MKKQHAFQLHVLYTQVFQDAYCDRVSSSSTSRMADSCKSLLEAIKKDKPHLLNKPKFHLLLHLPKNMMDFGPTSAFNAER